jgi:hypothetical protein
MIRGIVLFGIAWIAAGAERRRSYEELAVASDKVVLGTVGVKSSYWGDDAHIYTEILISPDVTIRGAEEGLVVVRSLGGTVGDTTMTVADGPEFRAGQHVVVFLKREGDHFVVVGRAAGVVSAAPEAAAAVESAFRVAERTAGRKLEYSRGLASSYMDRFAAAAQVGCYGTDGTRWEADSARYKIGTTIPAEWAASIDASASTWSNAGAAIRLINDTGSVNELSYKDLVATYGSSYLDTFAVTTTWSNNSTGLITKATTEFGTKWPWSTAGVANRVDVQNILTHELGHWMRLLDIYSPATCSEVTMWNAASYGETKKRTLEQADLDGLFSLYGRAGAMPGTPGPISPANDAMGVSVTAALTWSAATNATSYEVYFGMTSPPPLAGTVTATTFQPGALAAGWTYYWRVVAKNAAGSAASATFSFTVAGGTPTAGPTLVWPKEGATGVAVRIVMEWSAVPSATAYEVYVGTRASPGMIGTVKVTTAKVKGLRPGTVYYWKVVARTPIGLLGSAVGSFRTE